MTTAAIPAAAAFDLWASVYDQQPNPLLQLEQRFLPTILPPIQSLDVLDVGCGTGRWLQSLATQRPRSLTGIDSSPAMLQHAASRLGNIAHLRLGDCTALPVPSRSADLLLASFVLSYISDLETFALECDRVCRPGAHLFLTDMHPDTQRALNWKRSFQHANTTVDIDAECHSLQDIIAAFQHHGFETILCIEPTFGPPEQAILNLHNKSNTPVDLPPIYVLHMKKNLPTPNKSISPSLHLTGARIAHGAHEATPASIQIHDTHIHSVLADSPPVDASAAEIDLRGHLLLPGLINPHDHLEFALYPNLGRSPYSNAALWADDIHRTDATTIERHRSVPRDVRLWWGALRNLLCGVTTVCHHNPITPELLDPAFPVRVLTNFGWSHSLALDPDLVTRFNSTPPRQPFILHAAEGIDNGSAGEVPELDQLHILDNRTIIVHGLALTPQAVDLINQRDAAVILCPSSNQFLFHAVPSPEIVSSLRNVLLGSDSPLTATGDLLDEIRFAQKSLNLTAADLYAMATTSAARTLRLPSGEGRLTPNTIADLIAVKDKQLSPADTLAQLHFSDIELVILSGRVMLASQDLLNQLPESLHHGLEPLEIEGHLRWLRAPLQHLFTEATRVLGPDINLGGKQVRYAGTL